MPIRGAWNRMTAGQSINYEALTQDSLRSVVRMVLTQVAATGLPGDHHFYVAFDTRAPSVVLSRRLKEKYPDEMMIVLQHRFWDLLVTDERFEVKLTFDGIPERLVVPFSALRLFYDPSVRFTLQFGDVGQPDDQQDGARPRLRRDGADAKSSDAASGRIGLRGGAGDRRLRPGARTRGGERDGEDGAQPRPIENAPAIFVPRLADAGPKQLSPPSVPSTTAATTPSPVVTPSTQPDADADGADRQLSSGHDAADNESAETGTGPGAKVFSLDQFRKKT